MNDLILIAVSVIPIIVFAIYIYKKDREKEPLKLLFRLFLGGILSCIAVVLISIALTFVSPIFAYDAKNLNYYELFISIFVGVALVEEGCKFYFTYKIGYNNKEFDSSFDMIVYAAFVSLGFACFENFFYVMPDGVSTGLVRAITAIPLHVCCGVFMGLFLNKAKINDLRGVPSVKNKLLALIIPLFIHGLYDYIIFIEKEYSVVGFIVVLIISAIFAIKSVQKESINDSRFSI